MGGQTNVVAYALFFNVYIIVSMHGIEVVSSMLLCATNHRVHDSMLTFSFTVYMCNLSNQIKGLSS